MSLRQQAATDLEAIVEDSDGGFGWPISVRSPDGVTADLTGFSSDVSELIDPETGQAVSGRQASVSLRQAALVAAGLNIPRNIPEADRFPWVVTFDDILGNAHTFKVVDTRPDRAVGLVVLILESYRG